MSSRCTTYNQYLIFSIAIGAANVLTKLAHAAVIWNTIIPLARISSTKVSSVGLWWVRLKILTH